MLIKRLNEHPEREGQVYIWQLQQTKSLATHEAMAKWLFGRVGKSMYTFSVDDQSVSGEIIGSAPEPLSIH